MTSPPSFNLIDEPWIRVRNLTGGVEELSIRQTFVSAHQLRGLAGELPTQDVAILRLLLAVILGATRPKRERTDDQNVDLWSDWWKLDSFSNGEIDRYLDAVHARFNLTGPSPFLQVADLTTATGKRSGLPKLIADYPDGHAFFTTRGGHAVESIDLAEAARWLVHCQAFDPSGIKTGALGDDRVKGGKGYPFGYPAWAGNLGLVVAEGDTLFHTLLLNTPWTMSRPQDLPVWDRPALGPGVEEPIHVPQGPADLFTWPSRRLRLFIEHGRVVDIQISTGDKLTPQNRFVQEPMSAWRHSKNQSKGAAGPVFMPTLHDPSRRIWQGLGSLLIDKTTRDDERLPAPALEWLDKLRNEGELAPTQMIDLHVVGFEYGTQNSVVTGATDDRLTASVAAMTEPVLASAAIRAADRARSGVVALARLAGNLDQAAGGSGAVGDHTFEHGYSILDGAFRYWIRGLLHPDEVAQLETAWDDTAVGLLRQAADALLADAGPAALVGRSVTQVNGQNVQLDAGLAQIRFNAAIAKAFPFRTPHTEVKP